MEREKEGTRTGRKRSSTREAQPKSPKGTQEELGWRRAHKFPKRPQQKRARMRTNGRLRLRPKTRKGERNRATPKEDTSNKSLKVSNPRGRQRKQKEDLPGKDPKRETKDKGSEGGPRSKENTRDRYQGGRRQEGTPQPKEVRRPRRTRSKREQGGRSEPRHPAESGAKISNRNKERQRDAQA